METPALDHLMGAYFHQDWPLTGTEADVVADFLSDEPELATQLSLEIDTVLQTVVDEQELKQLLEDKGCSYRADPDHGGYRAWLAGVSARAGRVTQP